MMQGDAHPETRRMMETAIRRLNAFEYLILGVAMGLALLAGALAAWMAESLMGASFRLAWAFSSLLFLLCQAGTCSDGSGGREPDTALLSTVKPVPFAPIPRISLN